MTILLVSLGAFGSTLCGGLLALRLSKALHYILSFTAGVLLGVVTFEVLPEIVEIARRSGFDVAWSFGALVVGFLTVHTLEKLVLVHGAHESDYTQHRHPHVGLLTALALVGHSILDGVAMGIAFQESHAIGVSVAIAVIAHDFCDGFNTVTLVSAPGCTTRRAATMLVLDSIAPVLGVGLSFCIDFTPFSLFLYLGFFAGSLLYIAASDVLPEAHTRAKTGTALGLCGLTASGAAMAFAVSRLAN